MKVNITGKNFNTYDRLQETVEKKLDKLDKYFSDEATAKVVLSKERGRDKIEATINAKGAVFRAEEVTDDIYEGIDLAVDKLASQMSRFKGKLRKRYNDNKALKFEFMPEPETETEEPQESETEPGTVIGGVFLPRPEGETVTVCPPLPMISGYGDGRSLAEHLEEELRSHGVEFHPRSEEEILRKILQNEGNRYIRRLVMLICRFITNFKTDGYTEMQFAVMKESTQNVRTKLMFCAKMNFLALVAQSFACPHFHYWQDIFYPMKICGQPLGIGSCLYLSQK